MLKFAVAEKNRSQEKSNTQWWNDCTHDYYTMFSFYSLEAMFIQWDRVLFKTQINSAEIETK